MNVKLIIALLAAAFVVLEVWLLRGALLTPVRLGRGESLTVVLSVSGKVPEFENTVDCLLWLRQNGTLRGEIVVKDLGMDEDTREIADILERKGLIRLSEGTDV